LAWALARISPRAQLAAPLMTLAVTAHLLGLRGAGIAALGIVPLAALAMLLANDESPPRPVDQPLFWHFGGLVIAAVAEAALDGAQFETVPGSVQLALALVIGPLFALGAISPAAPAAVF